MTDKKAPIARPRHWPKFSWPKFNLRQLNFWRSSFFVHLPISEQANLAKSLAFLVKAGVPVLNSLRIIRDQSPRDSRNQILDQVISDVAGGQFLHTSLRRFRHIFGDFTINIIRIGETGGLLNQNLNYLAEELKKKQTLRRKVWSALLYPLFISLTTLVLVALLTVFIFPKILPILVSLHVNLPITTRWLIGLSNFLRHWGLWLASGLIIVIVSLAVLRHHVESLRRALDQLFLHVPLAARLIRSYNLTNICRTLGLLLRSGVRVTEAVEITAETTANFIYRQHLQMIVQSVRRGERLSKHLMTDPRLFPPLLTQLINIGETTGELTNTLTHLAELYEENLEELTKNLSSSIEPVLMIFMGLVVGLVAVSVISPIYQITQNLHPR